MFSYPLFERLKAATPEFEHLTAFQAGGARMSVRRQGVDAAPRPLRSEYVTGNYFVTFGRRRARRPRLHGRGRHALVTPGRGVEPQRVAAHLRQRSVRRRIDVRRRRTSFTIVGIAPPGFFGETLRGDPPDLWIPLQQEPLIERRTVAAAPAGVGVAARHRPAAPGATVDGMARG
jgi:hypothetical protein